ncbi:MAG: imidazole glycerol phosphate synthase cyclase subunit, partial [Anaerolineaceae bacterium]|nr:imidazole glycerol phosphate synthase cyclase subunit [Anaerolineaceae bacterium]
EGLRVMGKPEDFARHYYHNGADELIYMDAVASLYGRNSLLDIVERTSREIFIPLCVGGGLRSVEDIRAVLRAGADKVSLNTAAIENPELIRTASRVFGSSTVVVSIEAIEHADGEYEAFVEYGRQETGVDVFEWAQRAEALGAGELVITSINQEGTGEGFDLELTRRVAELVSIPVIAAGGAGNIEHVFQVIQEGKADAVSIASLLHYNVVRQQAYTEEQFSAEGNVEFLQGRRGSIGFSRIQETTLPALKDHLAQEGIDVRQQIIKAQE